MRASIVVLVELSHLIFHLLYILLRLVFIIAFSRENQFFSLNYFDKYGEHEIFDLVFNIILDN